MPRLIRSISLLAALAALGMAALSPARATEPENTLVLEFKDGTVTIELLPDLAPGHVARIKRLAREGFYNGVAFHRVMAGFMAQSGDPTGTGTGGSRYPDLEAEFTPYPYRRGTVGAARTMEPNTANSQFFICFNDRGCTDLTGQYTVWGQVVDGMEHVDKVKVGVPGSGMVTNPDRITKAYLASEAK